MPRYNFQPGTKVLLLRDGEMLNMTIDSFAGKDPEMGVCYALSTPSPDPEEEDLKAVAYEDEIIPAIQFSRVPTPKGIQKFEFRDDKGQKCSLEFNRHKDKEVIWLGVEENLQGRRVYGRMCLNRAQLVALWPALETFVKQGVLVVD